MTGWITTDTNVLNNLNTLHNDELEDAVEIVFEDDSQEAIEEHSHEEIKINDNRIDFNEGFREELENLIHKDSLEYACEKTNHEMILIGAGIWEGILHTGELHAMKFNDAMTSAD